MNIQTFKEHPMTMPQFTTVIDKPAEERVYLPWARCKGKLLIVRPLEYQREGFITANAPDGTDVVFADITLLDPIQAAVNEEGDQLPAFAAETQFRRQSVLAAYLKGTFKNYLGKTLIGTIYRGVPTKGKPPLMWQDLTGDAGCVQRGQQFLIAHPEFLIPQEASFSAAVPEVMGQNPGYTPPPRATGGSVYTQHSPGAGPTTQNTLEQMRAMAAANAQQDPPF